MRRRSESKRTVSENRELRKENGRLRKQLQRLGSSIDQMTEKEGIEPEKPIENTGQKCPKCGENIKEIQLGRFTYLFCSGCSFRQKK